MLDLDVDAQRYSKSASQWGCAFFMNSSDLVSGPILDQLDDSATQALQDLITRRVPSKLYYSHRPLVMSGPMIICLYHVCNVSIQRSETKE